MYYLEEITYPMEHQVSALASLLSIECLYDTNASWTLPMPEKHLKKKQPLQIRLWIVLSFSLAFNTKNKY